MKILHAFFGLIHGYFLCFQIPLPVLAVPTFVPGPAAASSAASAAPKYRTIAVEFDDQHNQERVGFVAAFFALCLNCALLCLSRLCFFEPPSPIFNVVPLSPLIFFFISV